MNSHTKLRIIIKKLCNRNFPKLLFFPLKFLSKSHSVYSQHVTYIVDSLTLHSLLCYESQHTCPYCQLPRSGHFGHFSRFTIWYSSSSRWDLSAKYHACHGNWCNSAYDSTRLSLYMPGTTAPTHTHTHTPVWPEHLA